MPNDFVLYDHRGNPIQSDKHQDGMDLPHVVTFGSILQGGYHTYWHGNSDEAIKHRRENALAMRRDCWLKSLIDERKRAVLKNAWSIEVDQPRDPRQKMVADSMTAILRGGVPRMKRFLRYLLEALWYGKYGVNVKWQWSIMDLPEVVNSGPVVPGMSTPQESPTWKKARVLTVKKHRPVNGDKIGNHEDGTPYVLIYGGSADLLPKSEIISTTVARALLLRGTWRDRFIIHTHDPDDADYWDAEMAGGVHGVGVRSRIYWLDFIRREYASWVADTLEKMGLGLVTIYYDMSNPASKAEALDAAKKYSRRSALVLPRMNDGRGAGGVEVIETPIAGAEIVQRLCEAIEWKIERYIVGQSMSSGADNEGSLGGTGRAKFAEATKADITADDCDDLAETITGCDDEPGLVSIIKKWVFPWADFPVRFTINPPEIDPSIALDAVVKAHAMGVTFPEEPVRELTGVRGPETGENTIGQTPGLPGAPNALPTDADQGEGEEINGETYLDDQNDQEQMELYAEPHRGQPNNAGQFGPGGGAAKTAAKPAAGKPSKTQRHPTTFESMVPYQGKQMPLRNFLLSVRKLKQDRPNNDKFNDEHRKRVESVVAGLIQAKMDPETGAGPDVLFDDKLGITFLSGVKGRDPSISTDAKGVAVSWGTTDKDRVVRLEPGFDEGEAQEKLRALLKMKPKTDKQDYSHDTLLEFLEIARHMGPVAARDILAGIARLLERMPHLRTGLSLADLSLIQAASGVHYES